MLVLATDSFQKTVEILSAGRLLRNQKSFAGAQAVRSPATPPPNINPATTDRSGIVAEGSTREKERFSMPMLVCGVDSVGFLCPAAQGSATPEKIEYALGLESYVFADQHGARDVAAFAHIGDGARIKARNRSYGLGCH
jgi:hypothetical protein